MKGETGSTQRIKYFKETFVKNERGNWVNPKDKTDWVLIWWKKQ